MENLKSPKMTPLKIGNSLKSIQLTAPAGSTVPSHHSVEEVAVIVQKGQAILKLQTENHQLTEGEVFMIPAGQEHSLSIEHDFKAILVMQLSSKIKFNKP